MFLLPFSLFLDPIGSIIIAMGCAWGAPLVPEAPAMSAPVAIPPGFFSVKARFNGQILCRANARGSVWAWRAPSAGHLASPACLFIPARQRSQAHRLAQSAAALGWHAAIRAGSSCAVWQSGPLASAAPALAVKVRLPPGVSASSARALLRNQLKRAS